MMKGRRVAKVNKLILDGVEYGLSDDLVAKLKEFVAAQDWAKKTDNPFGAYEGLPYYYIDCLGGVSGVRDSRSGADSHLIAVANYCRDEELMKQRALHETLNRLLWRYSETHGGDNSWETTDNHHYFICWGAASGLTVTYFVGANAQGVVYFKDAETAKSAIEEVVNPFLAEHPEFKW